MGIEGLVIKEKVDDCKKVGYTDLKSVKGNVNGSNLSLSHVLAKGKELYCFDDRGSVVSTNSYLYPYEAKIKKNGSGYMIVPL